MSTQRTLLFIGSVSCWLLAGFYPYTIGRIFIAFQVAFMVTDFFMEKKRNRDAERRLRDKYDNRK